MIMSWLKMTVHFPFFNWFVFLHWKVWWQWC